MILCKDLVKRYSAVFSSDIPTSIEEIRDNFLKNIQSIPKITYYIFLRHQIHIFNPIPPSPQVIQFIYSTPHPLKLLEPKSTHVHRKTPKSCARVKTCRKRIIKNKRMEISWKNGRNNRSKPVEWKKNRWFFSVLIKIWHSTFLYCVLMRLFTVASTNLSIQIPLPSYILCICNLVILVKLCFKQKSFWDFLVSEYIPTETTTTSIRKEKTHFSEPWRSLRLGNL